MNIGHLIVGAVLCGGASRRMGRDKALVEREGTALAVRVARALEAGGCDQVRAIGGDGPALEALGLVTVPDRFPGEGPLGGLATALEASPAEATLALAPCDLLDPQPAAMAALLAALAEAPEEVDAVVPVVDGREEWILSVWRVRGPAAARVVDLLTAGHRRLDAVDLVVRAVRLHELPATAVADADRPEDLT